MRILIRLIRIYTPFICSLFALINGALFMNKYTDENLFYLFSTTTGNSIVINIYMLCTSLRMCVWYKLNILCLCLIHITSILYNYLNISDSVYLAAVTLLSSLGIICFLVFKALYKVTEFGCSRRR